MESDFKKNVFDENLFQFSLELLGLMEKLGHSNSLVRKTLVDAFTLNNSLPELHTFIRTLNKLDLTDFQTHLPAFFENVTLMRRHSQMLFENYLRTVRHLADAENFTSWEEFFKATTAVSSKAELIAPFLTTVRHSLNYFKKPETFAAIMKTLANQSSLAPFEAYSHGQLESKKWLIEETLRARGGTWGTVFILAGWIGSLAQLIFDSGEVTTEKIRSFDIDAPSCKLAEKLNNAQVLDQWKFKSVNMDISLMNYPTEYFVKRHDGTLCELHDQPDLVINTSCEHIENLDEWWNKIPAGTPVVLQNNNAFHIADHINCVKSLEEFKTQLPLSKIDFAGNLPLPDYTRYMLIGIK